MIIVINVTMVLTLSSIVEKINTQDTTVINLYGTYPVHKKILKYTP